MGLAGFNRARLRHTIEGEQSPSLSNKPLHMIGYYTRECPVCGNEFKNARAVCAHIKAKHPDEQYKYEITFGLSSSEDTGQLPGDAGQDVEVAE